MKVQIEEKHKTLLYRGVNFVYRFFFLAPKPIRHIIIFELIWIMLIFGSGQGDEIFTFAFENYMLQTTVGKIIHAGILYWGFFMLAYFINMQCRWMYEKERRNDSLAKEQSTHFGFHRDKSNSALSRLALRRQYEEVHAIFWALLPLGLFVYKYIAEFGFSKSLVHVIALVVLLVFFFRFFFRKKMDIKGFVVKVLTMEETLDKKEIEKLKVVSTGTNLSTLKLQPVIGSTNLMSAQSTPTYSKMGGFKEITMNFLERKEQQDNRQLKLFQKLTNDFYDSEACSRTNRIDKMFLAMGTLVALVYLVKPTTDVLGPLTISFLGIMFISMLVTGLSYLLIKVDIPTFILVAGWIVFCSYFNNNHTLRTVSQEEGQRIDNPEIKDHFARWLDYRLEDSTFLAGKTAENPAPIYIIASEGGGIRSAYWTVTLLEKLQKNYPDFYAKCYGLSGVSGGSVGLATFNAYYKDHFIEQTAFDAEQKYISEYRSSYDMDANVGSAVDKQLEDELEDEFTGYYYSRASSVLGEDYLTPVLTGLLFPDMIQRVLPFCLPTLDRARLIENSWDLSYKKHTGFKTLKGGMESLWDGRAEWELPNLFFNTTRVETGEKVVISNLKLDPEFFPRSIDLATEVEQEFLLKSAAFASARFPLITPVARIDKPNGETWGNIVDGGYFDNTGLHTALEIVDMINEEVPDSLPIRPVVIAIRNSRDKTGEFPAQKGMHETLSPVKSFYNSWGARANYYAVDVDNLANELDFEYLLFNLPFVNDEGEDLGFPLGWTLSADTRAQMNVMVEKVDKQGRNFTNYKRLGKLEGE
ncbi:MAG: patatin-like phospholipase family protein [Bacteroidota bacterium]